MSLKNDETAKAVTICAREGVAITPHGGGAVQHVKNLSAFIAFTTEGNRLSWKLDSTTKAGEGKLAVVTPPAPPAQPEPPAPADDAE